MSESKPPVFGPSDYSTPVSDKASGQDRFGPPIHHGPSSRPPSFGDSNRKKLFTVFGVLAAVGLVAVLVCGGGIFFAIRALETAEQEYLGDAPKESSQEAAEKFRKAFDTEPLAIESNDHQKMEKLILALGDSIDDDGSFDRSMIDRGKYIRELVRAGFSESIVYLNHNQYASLIDDYYLLPDKFDRIRIESIEPIGEDEFVVYCYLWLDEDINYRSFSEVNRWRIWMTRSKSRWGFRIYDWQNIYFGMRDSHETAAVIDDTSINRRISNAYDRVDELLNQIDGPDSQQGIQSLEALTETADGSPVRDKFRLYLADRWYEAGEYERSKKLAESVDPTNAAGALRRKADSEFFLGQYQDAIDSCNRFRKQFGFHPTVEEVRAFSHRWLEQQDQVKQIGLELLQKFPESNCACQLLSEIPGTEDVILRHLQQDEGDFAEILDRFILAIHEYSPSESFFERFKQIMVTTNVDPVSIELLQSSIDGLRGDYDLQYETLKRVYDLAPNRCPMQQWVNAAIQCDRSHQLLAETDGSKQVFELITDAIFESYREDEIKDLELVLDHYEAADPDRAKSDQNYLYWRAKFLLAVNDRKRAEKFANQARLLARDPAAVAAAEELLLETLHRHDVDFRNALTMFPIKQSWVYLRLAQTMRQDRDWDRLKQLEIAARQLNSAEIDKAVQISEAWQLAYVGETESALRLLSKIQPVAADNGNARPAELEVQGRKVDDYLERMRAKNQPDRLNPSQQAKLLMRRLQAQAWLRCGEPMQALRLVRQNPRLKYDGQSDLSYIMSIIGSFDPEIKKKILDQVKTRYSKHDAFRYELASYYSETKDFGSLTQMAKRIQSEPLNRSYQSSVIAIIARGYLEAGKPDQAIALAKSEFGSPYLRQELMIRSGRFDECETEVNEDGPAYGLAAKPEIVWRLYHPAAAKLQKFRAFDSYSSINVLRLMLLRDTDQPIEGQQIKRTIEATLNQQLQIESPTSPIEVLSPNSESPPELATWTTDLFQINAIQAVRALPLQNATTKVSYFSDLDKVQSQLILTISVRPDRWDKTDSSSYQDAVAALRKIAKSLIDEQTLFIWDIGSARLFRAAEAEAAYRDSPKSIHSSIGIHAYPVFFDSGSMVQQMTRRRQLTKQLAQAAASTKKDPQQEHWHCRFRRTFGSCSETLNGRVWFPDTDDEDVNSGYVDIELLEHSRVDGTIFKGKKTRIAIGNLIELKKVDSN